MATIKDVAKDAGVSLGTVSKVLNGIHVSEQSKYKVETSIKKLNYQLNPNAHRLKAQKTNDILVIVPTLLNAIFPPMIDTIEKELNLRDMRMLLCISRNDSDKIDSYISMAANARVDGIFGVTYSKITDYSKLNIPMVSFDRHFEGGIPCISCDNEAGGYLAAKTLYEKGCRNILCFWAGTDYESEPTKRIAGFNRFCLEKNVAHNVLSFMDYNMADTGFMYPSDSYKKFIHSYLSPLDNNNDFIYDGIFASSDHLAHLICDELQKMGLRVPEDVQVIGFDGMPDFITGNPIVSSIRQPIEQIAKTGVGMLLDMIDGHQISSITNLPVSFVEGGTTL